MRSRLTDIMVTSMLVTDWSSRTRTGRGRAILGRPTEACFQPWILIWTLTELLRKFWSFSSMVEVWTLSNDELVNWISVELQNKPFQEFDVLTIKMMVLYFSFEHCYNDVSDKAILVTLWRRHQHPKTVPDI